MIKERTIIAFYSTVTCQRQPALGCVYKLVEINGKPKIKLSQDVEKVTMPGKKLAFRLYSNDGHALIDLLTKPEEEPPSVSKRVLCRHPFQVRGSSSAKLKVMAQAQKVKFSRNFHGSLYM